MVIALVATIGVGTVVAAVYAPGSPGIPFASPTFQVQPARAHYLSLSLNAAVYGVWYVPGTTTLIVQVIAAFPHTRFFGVGAVGLFFLTPNQSANSPNGNFSTPVYIDNEKTYLVFPGNLCPDTSKIPASGFSVDVVLLSDSPPGLVSFEYQCETSLSLSILTLGNPYAIVPSLIPPPPSPPIISSGREALNLENSAFSTNNTVATLYIRNTGTASVSLVTYYVKDSSGNTWTRTSWNGTTISPNALGTSNIAIGTSCNSCTYSGTSGAFTQFTSGNSYTVTVVTARNNQFSFTIVR